MAMFGALNRLISRLDAEPGQQTQAARNGPCGFQVLRNENKDIVVEPWFDFFIGINGRQIVSLQDACSTSRLTEATQDTPDPYLFAQEIKNCAGNSVALTIWSAKVRDWTNAILTTSIDTDQGQQIRDLHVFVPQQNQRLGLTLQWTTLSTTEDVWHILDVIPNSPADQAGLLPYGDYIIGTPEGIVQGESGLGELVEDFMARPLRLWVYNHEYTVTRPITITPSRNWGGEGALGCVLGFGALHHLPPALAEPPSGPGDTLFETARFSNEESRADDGMANSASQLVEQEPAPTFAPSNFVSPAAVVGPPPTSKPTGSSRTQRKARGGEHAKPDFDSMWKESEEKSKEVDFTPAPRADGLPPPPPKKSSPLIPPVEERRETASPAPIIDDDDDVD